MEILLGLVILVGVLWWWLSGHWMGRVVAFLGFAAVLGFGGAAILASSAAPPSQLFAAIIGATIGMTAAWFLAGIPTYLQRA